MFKSFRVAGLAAATVFLCAANSATASEVAEANPAAHAVAATPVIPPATNPAAVNAGQATPAALPAPVVESSTADHALAPGRVRPDHQAVIEAAPLETPAVGVTGTARANRSLSDLVADHAGAEVADEEFECLASAIYFESRGEPLEGQLAVAEVILNRVRSGRFRESICGVVKQPSQFSFVRRGVIPAAPRDSSAWHRAVAIAHIALNDLAEATGDDSLFFHATYVNPRWGRPRIARIGNHVFYR